MKWIYRRFLPTGCVVILTCVLLLAAQSPSEKPLRRAKAPRFDPAETSQIFFNDVFAKLRGSRPVSASGGTRAPAGFAAPSAKEPSAGAVFGVMAESAQNDYDNYKSLGRTQAIEGRRLNKKGDRVKSRTTKANALFITSGVLALATGVMALFTDWYGYADARLEGPQQD